MNNFTHFCPTCNREIEQNNRFPHYVCNTCAEQATDENGEAVKFYHARFISQGIQGYYRRNNELIPFMGNACYIKGIECHALDDGFGGVIIQPALEISANSYSRVSSAYSSR